MSDDLTCAYLLGKYNGEQFAREWQEAVEFDLRVMMKLVTKYEVDQELGYCRTCSRGPCPVSPLRKNDAAWCRVKFSRLEVEEEMDGR